jgi:hypothetical protein
VTKEEQNLVAKSNNSAYPKVSTGDDFQVCDFCKVFQEETGEESNRLEQQRLRGISRTAKT